MIARTPRSTQALANAACRGFPWRRGADLYLGVVVRASFRLVFGKEMQLTAPQPIRSEGDGLHPADMVPYHPHADVVVRASTFSRNAVHLRLDHEGQILIDKRASVAPAQAGGLAPLLPLPETAPARARWSDGVLELGDDLDWRYFQCAPEDQRTRMLCGGETLRIAGVHPTLEVVHFVVPTLRGNAYLAEEGAEAWLPLALSCDLLAVDLSAFTAELSWRGAVRIDGLGMLSRLHLLGTLAQDADTLQLPPIPSASRLPTAPPAHLIGVDVTTGTASLHHHVPSPHAGAPFELPAPGAKRASPIVPLPGTPWAGNWPAPPARVPIPAAGPPPTIVELPYVPTEAPEPPPIEAQDASPVSEPPDSAPTVSASPQPEPPKKEPAPPMAPERWQRRSEPPPADIPKAPARPPVPDVLSALYRNFGGPRRHE